MKILFDTYYFYPIIGGIETTTYQFAKELINLGHEVHVLTSKPNISPNDKSKLNLKKYEIIDGIHIHRIKQYPLPIYTLITINEIQKINPDIIHSQGLWRGFTSIGSKFLLNKKYVIQGHGSDIYVPNKILDYFKPLIYNNSSCILALSNDMKNIMQKSTNKQITIFSNGIDCSKFIKTNPTKNNIVFLGRLIKIKGIEYLINSLEFVKNDIQIHIIGDGEERLSLEKEAEKYKNKIKFYGKISNEENINIFSKSKIFVLPSIFEGQGIVLLEAMASGLPIVASNVDGIPSVIENNVNGFLVPSKNSKLIAEKIDYLLDNKDVWNEISNNNIEKAKQYDITNLTKQLLDIYKGVLK